MSSGPLRSRHFQCVVHVEMKIGKGGAELVVALDEGGWTFGVIAQLIEVVYGCVGREEAMDGAGVSSVPDLFEPFVHYEWVHVCWSPIGRHYITSPK